MKIQAILISILVMTLPLCSFGNRAEDREFIVWNVGQGQWATEVGPEFCLHFDIGGERNPTSAVLKKCREKMNYFFLSHLDWDHISFLKEFARSAPRNCLLFRPKGPASKKKQALILFHRLCDPQENSLLLTAFKTIFHPESGQSSNDYSRVVWSQKFRILIPGDSTSQQEKIWKNRIPKSTEGLILGHHGSKTSSSPWIFHQMPQLKWAVVSARKSRFGHPHPVVVKRLKKAKVPLIKTEDWGHLHFHHRSN